MTQKQAYISPRLERFADRAATGTEAAARARRSRQQEEDLKLFERHPRPWKADPEPYMTHIFVRDANKHTVILVPAVQEETTTEPGPCGTVVTIIKTPIPSARKFADLIAAIPDILESITNAQAVLEKDADVIDGPDGKQLPDAAMKAAMDLEAIIEKFGD